eukprot:CAMPEP_0181317212 /NCGR_PEP_ID=MMETSP1101-20121128/16335_1 /TAXON_ID=46948 /ORGANISM="Rhodomonas abbreviata, Strain Caron Lab Isolate" /LENGTH=140 /DNA_ID=CAMNT_0023424565 /DNA_START=282 /DNA_END=704 /DNA_ORIENTATION=+
MLGFASGQRIQSASKGWQDGWQVAGCLVGMCDGLLLRGGGEEGDVFPGLFGNETDFDVTCAQAMAGWVGKQVIVGLDGGKVVVGRLKAADENMNAVLHRPVEYWDQISGTLLFKQDADAFIRGNNVLHIGTPRKDPDPDV